MGGVIQTEDPAASRTVFGIGGFGPPQPTLPDKLSLGGLRAAAIGANLAGSIGARPYGAPRALLLQAGLGH